MSHSKPTQTNAEDEREARVPEPEVLPGAKRRRFSVEYKQRILEEADACTQRGQIGRGKRRDLHTKAGWGRIGRHPSGQVKWVFFIMIKEIQAKVLVSYVKQPDPWFGLKYNMNLYRGCQHQWSYWTQYRASSL